MLKETIVVNDVRDNPYFFTVGDMPIASEVAFPVLKRGKLVGVLNIDSDKINSFSSEDIKIFQAIVNELSIMLERFESVTESTRYLFRIETVYKLAREIVLIHDIDDILDTSTRLIFSALGKKGMVVEINIIEGDVFTVKSIYTDLDVDAGAGRSYPINSGLIGRCIRDKKIIHSSDLELEPDAVRFYSDTLSELVVPLIVEDEVIGVINCESVRKNAFDQIDIITLQTIADMVSVAIRNAALYQKLAESEERYRAIFEDSIEAIFRIYPDGRFLAVNPAFIKMFGFESDEEISEINFFDLFIDKNELENFKSKLLTSEHFKGFEVKLRKKDGDSLITQISISKFEDVNRKFVFYDGIIVDLTEYRTLMEKFAEAEKLRGLGQIAGGIAHEFNNILAGILGAAQLIKLKVKEGESKIYEYADIIERSTARGTELVKKLLGYARKGKYEVGKIDITKIIREVIGIIAPTLDRRIVIETDLDFDIPEIEGDRGQLSQVFLDMFINAADAMPSGGVLRVSAEVRFMDESYRREEPDFIPGEYICISIEDTGIGMTEEVRKKIFEPFFTTKREEGKVGLGLSMAYGVVKNHNGYMFVRSTPGKGTRFDICFPIPPGSRVKISEKLQQRKVREKGGESKGIVLIVDDEEVVRRLLRESLISLGYKVFEAENGIKALEIFSEKKGVIDVVILDMIMPYMDGEETFRKLRLIKPDIKVILSSGYTLDAKTQELLEQGAVGYIQKPYKIKELESVLEKTLRV